MKKLNKFFQILKASDEVINGLQEAGVNVPRLVQISNAQGPLADLLRGFIAGASQQMTTRQIFNASADLAEMVSPDGVQGKLPSKAKRTSRQSGGK